MPLYEYHCERCGKNHTRVQRMTEEHSSSCCGEKSRRIFTPIRHSDVYTGKYEPALRRYVGTKTERNRLMKEKNLIDYPYDD